MSSDTNNYRKLGRTKRGYTFIALSSEGFDPKESPNIELLQEHALDICRWNGAETIIYKAYPAASVTIEDGTVHLQEMVLRAHSEQEALQALLDYLNKETSYHSRMERSLIESGDYEQAARSDARRQLAMDIAKKIEVLLQPDGGAPAEAGAASTGDRTAELEAKIEELKAKVAELEAKTLGPGAEPDLKTSHPFMAACLANLQEEGSVEDYSLNGNRLTVWGPMEDHQFVKSELAVEGAHADELATIWACRVFTIREDLT